MPDPLPPERRYQAIQDAYEAPPQPRRMHGESFWSKTAGHSVSLTLGAAGVFLVAGSVLTPSLGSTRSARLAWQKNAADAARTVDDLTMKVSTDPQISSDKQSPQQQ